MLHKIENLKITENFKTTIEITGNEKSGKAIFFSHGFGVNRNARGLFTDIENTVKQEFLCIRFDYNQILDNGDMIIDSYSNMANTFLKVMDYIEDTYSVNRRYIIAHSLGCTIVAIAMPKNIEHAILLAPPIYPPYNEWLSYFGKRDGTKINPNGISILVRSDGKKSLITKGCLDDAKKIIPIEKYKTLSETTKLSFIKPADDILVKDSYNEIYSINNVRVIEQKGDHDFSNTARQELLLNIKHLLQIDEAQYNVFNKALILPYNNKGEILIQDRRNHRPPPWGYFGGSIEDGETSLEAVIRETKEELGINLTPNDLQYFGEFTEIYNNSKIIRQCYLWKMNIPTSKLILKEGKAMKFVLPKDAKNLLELNGDKRIAQKADMIINGKTGY